MDNQHHDHTHAVTIKAHKALKHSRHEFEVAVPAAHMTQFFDTAYQRLAPSVEIKGFRPGQAPRAMTISKLGSGRYYQTALDLALPNTYAEALHILDLRPVAPPEITVKQVSEGGVFVYTVVVDVVPQVDPGNYAKLKVKAPKVETKVEAKEIDEVLERLCKQQAKTKVVDRAAKLGDRVEIDYIGAIDHVKRDDLSSQHFPVILGDGVLPKKLEDSLVGKKRGEQYELDEKINKDSVHFTVSVKEVTEIELPKVDDAFAGQFGRKDAADLKKAIEEQLTLEKQQQARHGLESKVLDELLKKVKLELPRSLVEEELTRRLDGIKAQLGQMFPKFLEAQKKTEEEIRKELESEAERSVKTGLVLGEIAKREGFGTDRGKDEDDTAFQRRVVRRTINFLVASATGEPGERSKK